MIKSLLSQFRSRLGLEPQTDDQSLLTLEFEGGLTVALSPEGDTALTLYAYLGDLPAGAADVAEHLLAANLFWRDTEGATLSLEPYSRGIYLARSIPVSMLPDVQALEALVESFTDLVARWRQVLPALGEPASLDRGGMDARPGTSSLV